VNSENQKLIWWLTFIDVQYMECPTAWKGANFQINSVGEARDGQKIAYDMPEGIDLYTVKLRLGKDTIDSLGRLNC